MLAPTASWGMLDVIHSEPTMIKILTIIPISAVLFLAACSNPGTPTEKPASGANSAAQGQGECAQ